MNAIVCSTLVFSISLTVAACGRKGPLVYPDMLVPAAPEAVTAMQSGAAVKLQFALPNKDRAGRPVRDIAGVKITRRATEAALNEVCRSCLADYSPFSTIYLDHLPSNTQRFGSRLILLDSDAAVGNLYSYSVGPFTVDGVDGASSRTADVLVVAPFPAPILKLESLPTEVRLQINLPPLTSGSMIGYNLYRSSGVATVRSYQPLNSEPLTVNKYIDTALERGVKYSYSARALILLASGKIAESAGSDEVEGMLKDDE